MSELSAQYVKTGYWVNQAQGSIMGQTITTDTRTGSIITALLAVLTTLGMSHLWHLITYAWHQKRAGGKETDALFRQQQVLLRTLPTPSTLAADSLKLWLAWRRLNNGALWRTLLQGIIALLFALASLAAATFSAYVAVSSNVEVLVDSPHCGTLNFTYPKWDAYTSAVEAAINAYAPACYTNASLPSQCNVYSKPNIAFSTKKVECPFEKEMCATPAIEFDSGPVNVKDAFGLNIDEKDNLSYRKKTVCAMLPLEGRTAVVNASEVQLLNLGRNSPVPGELFNAYGYGARNPYDGDHDTTNWTWAVSLIGSNYSKQMEHKRVMQYSLQDETEQGAFVTIPALRRRDTDVAIRLNVLNQLHFGEPIDDPMFPAHKIVNITDGNGIGNLTTFKPDYPATVTACTEQYQFCFNLKDNKTCSDLWGFQMINITEKFTMANEVQIALVTMIRNAVDLYDMAYPSRYKVEAELANWSGFIASVPDDHWIEELRGWYSIVWAAHQAIVTDYAIGPTVRTPLAEPYTVPPSSDAERHLCGTQKMRKPGGFVNFNFFGLVFIITVSSVFTLIDITLLRFIALLKKITRSDTPRLDRWIQDGLFHLQRLAYEAHGERGWKDLTEEVPTTVRRTTFTDLPLRYEAPRESYGSDRKDVKVECVEDTDIGPKVNEVPFDRSASPRGELER